MAWCWLCERKEKGSNDAKPAVHKASSIDYMLNTRQCI